MSNTTFRSRVYTWMGKNYRDVWATPVKAPVFDINASLYLNAEVHIRMKQFQTYLLNGTAGVLLFNDTGRV